MKDFLISLWLSIVASACVIFVYANADDNIPMAITPSEAEAARIEAAQIREKFWISRAIETCNDTIRGHDFTVRPECVCMILRQNEEESRKQALSDAYLKAGWAPFFRLMVYDERRRPELQFIVKLPEEADGE